MAGLLDAFGDDNTRFSLGLLAAAGPRFDGANDGQRIQEALAGFDAYKNRQAQGQMQKLQLDAAQAQMAKQKQMEELAKRYATPAVPAQQGPQVPLNIQGDTGPNLYSPSLSNMSTSGMTPAKPAGFDFQGYAQAMAGVDPMESLRLQQVLQKDKTPLTIKEGEVMLDRETMKPIFSLPKPKAAPAAVQEYEYALGQGYKGSFEQFQLAQKRAGASTTNISMSDGQKGFDNEMKLGGAFKQEPIYKDHSAMQGAFQQIKASLSQGTPISDTAAATKIMKLLDPGSVVRESELGMAMAAGGRMDRLREYLSQSMSGTKLTPTQRQDFLALATELTAASAHAYNSKRSEYRQQGSEYGLNADRALGKPADVPALANSGSDSQLSVVAPNGKTYVFKDQKALANWKMVTGVK
ncbi:hypothetical protein [Rhodoferax bucti]|uniref:hypothetical protein n=1 Tax=Rhodoferax bucti TaxID=2576305 RepID=UPI001108E71E|nr:hypothetical protein [Rhodoferax bucti]